MTEQIIGKTPADIEQMVETFSDLIINGDVPNADILGDAAVLKASTNFLHGSNVPLWHGKQRRKF